MEGWEAELASGRPDVAWDQFLDRYRRLIFAAIRHYAQDYDDVMDVFARVCEALREDELRRLRAYTSGAHHDATMIDPHHPSQGGFMERRVAVSVVARCLVSLVPLALAGCRDDSTTAPNRPVAASFQASRVEADADEPPQFSAWSPPVNLGPPVNTAFMEQGTSLSKDGRSLYFQCGNCPDNVGSSDIFVAQRTGLDDPWGVPQRLGPNINTTSMEGAPRLSRDGHWLFFNSIRPAPEGVGGIDIYVSHRRDKGDDFGWEPAVALRGGINTAADDQQPDPFEDEATGTNTLYYAVGPAGAGGTDIYVSTRLPDGTYGPGTPVTELNTSSIERQPAIRRDGLEIFFASDRDGPPGNLDLFVAARSRTSDPWSTPMNVGPVVNSTLIDARPALSFDGTTLYFQSTRAGAVGCTSTTGPCVFDLWVTTRTKLTGSN